MVSYFYNNGYLQTIPVVLVVSYYHLCTLIFQISLQNVANAAIKNTTFRSNRNRGTFFINVTVFQLINVQFLEILLVNNTIFSYGSENIHLFSWYNVALLITSSNFVGNYGDNVLCFIEGKYKASVEINKSNFTANNLTSNLGLFTVTVMSWVKSEITFYMVQFNNNLGRMSVTDVVSITASIDVNI